MKEMREFFEELLRGDSISEVLRRNKMQVVKLALVLVAAVSVCFLYLYQSSGELAVSDASTQSEEAGTEFAEDASADAGLTGDASSGAAGTDGSGLSGANGGITEDDTRLLDTDGIIYVDIGGAVRQPMLAELPQGSRIEDAIEAAGGLTKKADLTNVNRAQILTDGEKIYIPKKGEARASGSGSGGSGSGSNNASGGSSGSSGGAPSDAPGISSGKININTADTVLLQQLTGVGPVTAQKIVDYREQNGQFGSIEELKNVSGIGDKTFEKMRDEVTI